jgi:glycosyltransferase involved in cell wall biosynthesis
MVIAEAFAASLPIIAFDVGGLSERIQTNKNGLLVEPNNIDLFAETISELISDTNKYQKLSMDAISTAKTKFNLENMISDHLKFYGISK